MLNYLLVSGDALPEGSPLPKFPDRDDIDLALGGIPGWVSLLAPERIFEGRALDLVTGHLTANVDNPQTPSTFPNGSMGFHSPLDGPPGRRILGNVEINPKNFSIFFVIRPEVREQYQRLIETVSEFESGVIPRFALSENARHFNVWDHQGGTERLRYTPAGGFANRTTLLTLTFSEREGLSLFANGILVEERPADTRPLTAGYGIGEWEYLRQFRGLFGMMGHMNIDLRWPEHAGFRRRIETFMMQKYGIA